MVSNSKKLKLMFGVLLACATTANVQVWSAGAESVVREVINPAGGFIEVLERVRVPARFFAVPETVSVRISDDPTTDAARAGYELHGAGRGPYLPSDVLIESSQKPQSDYELTIMLPGDYVQQVPSNLKLTAVREVLHGSPSELHYHYEEVAADLDIKYRQLHVKVPKLSFYRLEQLYDTIVVGCVPR